MKLFSSAGVINNVMRSAVLALMLSEAIFAAAPDMVRIPAAPDFSFAADGEASPIKQAYYLAKYPVTNAEYAEFCEATGHELPRYWQNGTYPKGKANHPVLWVSMYDAEAYCEWLSNKYPGKTYRLPTEAEWEFAASGPQQYRYPWGNETEIVMKNGLVVSRFNFNGVIASILLKESPNKTVTFVSPRSSRQGEKAKLSEVLTLTENGGVQGWQDHRNGGGFAQTDVFKALSDDGGYTSAVNAYPKGLSHFGIFDMSGNAWEWTSSEIIATNGAERGQTVQAIRGGSWYATSRSCSVTFRGEGRRASGSFNTVGFRVAADEGSSSQKSAKKTRRDSAARPAAQRSPKRKGSSHVGETPSRDSQKGGLPKPPRRNKRDAQPDSIPPHARD